MIFRPILPLLLIAGMTLALLAASWLWGWGSKTVSARVNGGLRVLLAILAVGIALRPVEGHQQPTPAESRSDVLIMIDRTASMGATDFAGGNHRMDGVAADLTQLVQSISGAQLSVIVIDDEAQLAVPFTTDDTAVASYVSTVGWRNSKKASGTDISVGVDLARAVLERDAAEHPDHLRYFVYCGDGEQTVATSPQSFAEVGELVTGALVLGYGTVQGGVMTTSPDSDELVMVDGVVQKSVIDEANLKAVAEQLGGQYLHRDGTGTVPELVPGGLESQVEFVTTTEYYWLIALAGVPVVVYLLGQSIFRIRAARAELK